MKNAMQYWNKESSEYGHKWTEYKFRKRLNTLELAFIRTHIVSFVRRKMNIHRRYLDIGIGTGRIIRSIVSIDPSFAAIEGFDISQEMISICSQSFRSQKKIRFSQILDDAAWPSSLEKFHVITFIRVLKYIKNKSVSISQVSDRMHEDGLFLFTITNAYLVARFDSYAVGHYPVGLGSMKRILKENMLTVESVEGFQKLPEFLYIVSEKIHALWLIYFIERVLRLIVGPVLFSRILYVAAKKI